MSTLGPGDRAIIIRSHSPDNLGKVVQVVRVLRRGEIVPEVPAPAGKAAKVAKETLLVESLGGLLTSTWVSGGVTRGNLKILGPDRLRKLDDPDNVNAYDLLQALKPERSRDWADRVVKELL